MRTSTATPLQLSFAQRTKVSILTFSVETGRTQVLTTLAMTLSLPINYRPQQSCGQGYVFTRVCDSVHRGVSGQTRKRKLAGKLAGRTPPPHWDQADTPQTIRTPPWDQADPPGPGRHPPGPGRHPPDQADTPPGRRLQHTVNERPVRILLECILVENLKRQFGEDINFATFRKF